MYHNELALFLSIHIQFIFVFTSTSQTIIMNQNQAKALELKDQGNILFKIKNYQAAIDKYTEAMTYCPTISILFSNRSRSYRQLQQYEKSYADAEKAVQLDDKNIKAYYLMGETLAEIALHSKDKNKIQMAIEQLKKCQLDHIKHCGCVQKFVDQIYKAKKKLWHLTTEENAEKKKLLRSYLINIVETDQSITEEEKDALNENVNSLIEKKFTAKSDVPRALICSITKMIMKNPVCNEYGNSYSRRAYDQQLKKNGRVDPISSKPIKTNILYSNINLKKAIQHFLDKNPWVYEQIVA